jgi:hypothetical protein
MSNTIRTQTSTAQTRPQPQAQEGFFGKIGRVLKETFATPEMPAQKAQGQDTFMKGVPALSVAAARRVDALVAGRNSNARNQNPQNPSQDAQLVAYLNHISSTGDPSV